MAIRRRWLALAAPAALMLAACGSDSDDAGQAGKGDRVVEVRMLASKRFQPDTISAKAGETVTFKVINEDKTLHEFTLGDEARQTGREKEMAVMGAEPMEMDDETDSLTVAGGTTEELTYTFDKAGTVLYGSHQPGDYAAGMKGTITVT